MYLSVLKHYFQFALKYILVMYIISIISTLLKRKLVSQGLEREVSKYADLNLMTPIHTHKGLTVFNNSLNSS